MLEQQLLIDQLNEKLKKMDQASPFRGPCGDGPPAAMSAQRPYSVPLTKRLLQSIHTPLGLDSRKVAMKMSCIIIRCKSGSSWKCII